MRWEVAHRPAYSTLKLHLTEGEEVWGNGGAYMLHRGCLEVDTVAEGGLLASLRRALLGGATFFLNRFRACGDAELWLAPALPGDIAYLELSGNSYYVQDFSYLAHHGDVKVDAKFLGLRGLLAEGELFWLKLEGVGGAWVSAYGALEEIELGEGEEVTVDNYQLVALSGDAHFEIKAFGGRIKTLLFSGEGLVVRVRGPARVVVQSRSLAPLARAVARLVRGSD